MPRIKWKGPGNAPEIDGRIKTLGDEFEVSDMYLLDIDKSKYEIIKEKKQAKPVPKKFASGIKTPEGKPDGDN